MISNSSFGIIDSIPDQSPNVSFSSLKKEVENKFLKIISRPKFESLSNSDKNELLKAYFDFYPISSKIAFNMLITYFDDYSHEQREFITKGLSKHINPQDPNFFKLISIYDLRSECINPILKNISNSASFNKALEEFKFEKGLKSDMVNFLKCQIILIQRGESKLDSMTWLLNQLVEYNSTKIEYRKSGLYSRLIDVLSVTTSRKVLLECLSIIKSDDVIPSDNDHVMDYAINYNLYMGLIADKIIEGYGLNPDIS